MQSAARWKTDGAMAPPAARSAASPPRAAEQILSGWSNYEHQKCFAYRPEKIADVRRIIASAPQKSIISRGLGRSYNDAALNQGGGVMLQTRLNRLLDFDPLSGELECEAGATIGDIIDFALPRGWFPSVTPGTKFATVGGAIAADVHGKNHHQDGSFASCVSRFRLLVADGRQLICSREENSEVFWATLGGMGLTGAILDAKIKLEPVSTAYVTVDYRRAGHLDQALEEFAASDHRFAYSVAWIDCLARGKSLGRSVLMRGNHTPLAELPRELADDPREISPRKKRSIPWHFPNAALNAWTARAFNALYYGRNYDRQAIVDYDSFFYPLDRVLHWNRIYGRRGFAQYQAAFPASASRTAIATTLEKLARRRAASFLAVLKTFGPGNSGLLSFPREGHTLALDLPNRRDLREVLQELDELVLDHGGRVYLAKNPCLRREAFERMYPAAESFRRIKQDLDPDHRFDSSLARRLGLTEPALSAAYAA